MTLHDSLDAQRAVDTTVDDDCTSTGWLTLGQGTVFPVSPFATDAKGTGRADLFRPLPASPGTQFDIHFQVIDADTSAVVLKSACYQFRVSQ